MDSRYLHVLISFSGIEIFSLLMLRVFGFMPEESRGVSIIIEMPDSLLLRISSVEWNRG
jgi:hypothetical protein